MYRWYKIVISYGCPPVWETILSLKLVDYLHIQTDTPCYDLLLFYLRICEKQFQWLIQRGGGALQGVLPPFFKYPMKMKFGLTEWDGNPDGYYFYSKDLNKQ